MLPCWNFRVSAFLASRIWQQHLAVESGSIIWLHGWRGKYRCVVFAPSWVVGSLHDCNSIRSWLTWLNLSVSLIEHWFACASGDMWQLGHVQCSLRGWAWVGKRQSRCKAVLCVLPVSSCVFCAILRLRS